MLTPLASRVYDLAAFRSAIQPDVTVAQPIALAGHVRFDLLNPRRNRPPDGVKAPRDAPVGFACDSYCLAALFTPGVTAVTINESSPDGRLAANARTYRLARRPDCRSNVDVEWSDIRAPLPNPSASGGGIDAYEDGKVLVSQWAMKLANDVCLMMDRAGQPADYMVAERQWDNGARPGDYDFGPGRIEGHTVEIAQGDVVVHREHLSTLRTLAPVLFIEPTGMIESTRFALSRAVENSRGKYATVSLPDTLVRHTNLAGYPEAGLAKRASTLLPDLRRQLERALANPAATAESASFQVMESYFKAVGSSAEEADVTLIARLVGDTRLTRFDGTWALQLPAEQVRPIYQAYTARLLATGAPLDMRKSGMGQVVQKLGPAAAELIGPPQERLLAAANTRAAVPELIRALGHGDAENGSRLLAMLREHAAVTSEIHRQRDTREIGGYGREVERDAHIDALGAAKAGLCLLAPRDPALLADLEAFLASGAMPSHLVDGHALIDWQVILARMGKPIDAMTKPARMSGTEANHRRNLRMKVEHWTPDRC